MLKRNQDFSCLASSIPAKRIGNAYMVELIKTMKQFIQPESVEKKCLHSEVVNLKKSIQRMLDAFVFLKKHKPRITQICVIV